LNFLSVLTQITKSSLTHCKTTSNPRGFVVVDSVVNPPNFRTIGAVSSDQMYWPCPRLAHLFQTCWRGKDGSRAG